MNEEAAYFEHGADIGVIGRGATVEAALVEAACAMFAIMAAPREVQESLSVGIEFEESDVELALVTWLNRLLAEARLKGAVFNRFELSRDGAHYVGRAYGCRWNPEIEPRHRGQGRHPGRALGAAACSRLGSPLHRGCLKWTPAASSP